MTGDVARAGALVRVPPEAAFRVFTEDIDRWWRRGKAYRLRERSIVHLEPFVGGRLYETFATASGEKLLPTGEVLVWEPPARLVVRWRAVNFRPGEATEVEVRFEPRPSGTWVSVEHRGWSGIRPAHPVRHGEPVDLFLARTGRWWAGLLVALAERAEVTAGGG